MVFQGQVFDCDFGVERGVELSGERLALVISRDEYNSSSSSVVVVPTTRSGVNPRYLRYYPRLESLDTWASCRNLRTVDKSLLGSLEGVASRAEIVRALRLGVWPYLRHFLLHGARGVTQLDPGTVHCGVVPNSGGGVEESLFLVLAYNEVNGFATVAKVDFRPPGESQVRIPLEVSDGPLGMVACSHRLQSVDIDEAFLDLTEPSYAGRVRNDSLAAVVDNVVKITGLPAP